MQVQISQRRASSQIYIQRGKCLAHFQLWFNEMDWGQSQRAGAAGTSHQTHLWERQRGREGREGWQGHWKSHHATLSERDDFPSAAHPFLSHTHSQGAVGGGGGGAEAVPAAHKGPSDSVWRINLATTERKWSSQLHSLRSTLRLCFRRILSSKITPPAQCVISEGLGKSMFKSVASQWYGEGGGDSLVGTDSSETSWERCHCHSVWKAG